MAPGRRPTPDDPTAADANPAGLARLDRPEVLASLRRASFDTEFTGAARPVALRGGLWTDPDHDGIRGIDGERVHVALGAGAKLGRGWVVDGAARFGDTVDETMVALGYRF